MKSVFIIGEQRSGSNLLRLMLNTNVNIAAPHPPHILSRFYPLVPLYGNLQQEERFRALIQDVLELVARNPISWKIPLPTIDAIRGRVKERNLISIFTALMDDYAELQNATTWICKSMQNVAWADEIERYLHQSFYIYLYRDPRDVVQSFSKAIIGEKHPYFIAKRWVALQQKCLHLQKNIPPERFFSLSYENLIHEPQQLLKLLMEHLGLSYSKNMLTFYKQNEATNAAVKSKLWENLSKPILAHNSNKFYLQLTEEEIWITEVVAGEIMDRLGYDRVLTKKGEKYSIEEHLIHRYSLENEQLKKKRFAQADPYDKNRRNKQLLVLENVKERYGKEACVEGIK